MKTFIIHTSVFFLCSAVQAADVFLTMENKPKNALPGAALVESFEIDNALFSETIQSASLSLRKSGGAMSAELPSMRGFYSKQTAVLIDGIELPRDVTGTNDLSLLPFSIFRKADLIKGGLSPVYGANAEGGAISFYSLPHFYSRDFASFDYSLSSFGENSFSMKNGLNKKDFSMINSAAYTKGNGFQENSSYEKKEASLSFARDAGHDIKLSFLGFASGLDRGLPGGTPFDISLWDGEKEKKANTPWNSQKDDLLWGALKIEKKAGEGAFFMRLSGSSLNTLARQYNSYLSSMDENRTAILGGLWEAGFNSDSSGIAVQSDRRRLISSFYGDRKLSANAASGFFKVNLSESVSLTPSARFDDNKKYKDQFSPGISLIWTPRGKWTFSAKAVRAWQAPTFADLYNPWAPNENLKPERSIQGEISISRKASSGFEHWTSLYYSDIKDRIALDPARNWAAYNIDSAFNRGIETGFSFFFRHWSFRESLSLSKAMGKSAGDAYSELPYLSNFANVAAVSFRRNGFFAEFLNKTEAEKWTSKGKTGKKIPPYSVSSMNVSFKSGDLTLDFSILNIFDKRYALNADSFNGYYPADPRTFRAGISVSFI